MTLLKLCCLVTAWFTTFFAGSAWGANGQDFMDGMVMLFTGLGVMFFVAAIWTK